MSNISSDQLAITISLLHCAKYRAEEYYVKSWFLNYDNQARLDKAIFNVREAIAKLEELREALKK